MMSLLRGAELKPDRTGLDIVVRSGLAVDAQCALAVLAPDPEPGLIDVRQHEDPLGVLEKLLRSSHLCHEPAQSHIHALVNCLGRFWPGTHSAASTSFTSLGG